MTDFSDTRLRVIFAGTPDFAACHLKALLDDGRHDVVAVYTQPDRPFGRGGGGRGKQLAASPVKELALEHGLPVYQPLSLKDTDAQQQLAELNADIMVVVAYGLLLPKAVLDTPRLGCINVHASLLPRWRGAAPIQRAIEAGDAETGVTIMQMDIGLDTGDILIKANTPIDQHDTAASLHDRLAELGKPALLKALELLAEGEARPKVQDNSLANYASKLSKEEALIHWQQPATEIDRKVRAFNPFPVATTDVGGQRVRIWAAEPQTDNGTPGKVLRADNSGIVVGCGKGSLCITELQLPGKKRLTAAEVLRGNAELFAPGTQLGSN